MAHLILSIFLSQAWAGNIPINSGPSQSGGSSNPIDPSLAPTLTYSGPSWVCASDISTKVFQSGGSCSDSWALNVSTPSGLPNESVYAQIHLINVPQTLSNVQVDMTIPTLTSNNAITLSTQSATSAGVCRLYLENYVHVVARSVNITIGGGYYNAQGLFVPDSVIPRRDPYYNQVTNAFPASVTSGNNQSFLMECDLPSTTQSGFYTYNITVSTGATAAGVTVVATIPGAIEVGATAIPASATQPLYTGVDSVGACSQYYNSTTCVGAHAYNSTLCGTSDTLCQDIIFHDIAVYCLDHRTNCTNMDALAVGSTFAIANSTFSHLWTGTTSAKYINTIFSGAKLTATRAALQSTNSSTMSGWVTGFTSNSYSTTTIHPFDQACDEPGASWGTCQNVISSISGSNMPTLASANYNQMTVAGSSGTLNSLATLQNDLGTTSGLATNTVNWVNTASGSTRSAGQYNDCESGGCSGNGAFASCTAGKFNSSGNAGSGFGTYPNHHVDGLPIANYVTPLSIWQSSFSFQLNSDLTICWLQPSQNGGIKCGGLATSNPWTDGGLLYNAASDVAGVASDGQGDETWLMPCTTSQCGTSTPFPAGTLRLLLNTVGEQDVERATILANNGLNGYAQAQLANWYNNTCDYNMDSYKKGSFNGTRTQMAQNYLCKIQGLTYVGASCAW